MICPECGVTLQVLSDGRYSAVVADDGTTQESDVCPRCGDAVKLADTLAELPSTPSMMSRRDRERAEQAAAVGISYTPSLIDDRARIGIALNFYIDRCNWSTEDDERSEYERLEREYTPEHLRHLIDR